MIPPSIRAVVFDAVGTVIHPDPPAAVVYAETARRSGVHVTPAEVAAGFRSALAAEDAIDRAAGWVTSEARERTRWQRIVSAVLPGVSDGCFAELFGHFARPAAWRVDPDAGPVFDTLAARGWKLGLASNYDRRLRSVLAGLPALRPLAERVVISSEVGVRKPGPGFFLHVAATMDESPAHVAFVGDDRENDFDGAAAAGMTAVLLDPRDRFPTLPRRIRTLTELTTPVLRAGRP